MPAHFRVFFQSCSSWGNADDRDFLWKVCITIWRRCYLNISRSQLRALQLQHTVVRDYSSPKGLSATQKVFFVVLKHRVPRRNFKQERIQERLARLWKGSIRILQEGFFFLFLKSVLNKWESRQRRRSLPVTLNEVLRIILAGDSALRPILSRG